MMETKLKGQSSPNNKVRRHCNYIVDIMPLGRTPLFRKINLCSELKFQEIVRFLCGQNLDKSMVRCYVGYIDIGCGEHTRLLVSQGFRST